MILLCTAAVAQGSLSNRYVAFAIQGDLRPAAGLLASLDASGSDADLALATQFHARFVARSEPAAPASGDVLVDRVVAAYRTYWREALMGDQPPAQSEARLLSTLRAALAQHGANPVPGDGGSTYAALAPALEDAGYHVLASHASPLQDLFLWRRQETREYLVELTDQSRSVRVAFLSEFPSQGWKHYASLGLATTTGWVEGDTLYCVEWAYAPDSENFRVSYLQHEARHLADFERFPGLSSAELEYRAKLTELAFATTTLPRLLEDFRSKAALNPESPHALANHRVVEDLHRELFETASRTDARWPTLNPAQVNRAARQLLVRDTQRLEGQM